MKNVIYIMYWVFRLLFFLAGFSASAEQGYQLSKHCVCHYHVYLPNLNNLLICGFFKGVSVFSEPLLLSV